MLTLGGGQKMRALGQKMTAAAAAAVVTGKNKWHSYYSRGGKN